MTNLAYSYCEETTFFDLPSYNNNTFEHYNSSPVSRNNDDFLDNVATNSALDLIFDAHDGIMAQAAYDSAAFLTDDNVLSDFILSTTPPFNSFGGSTAGQAIGTGGLRKRNVSTSSIFGFLSGGGAGIDKETIFDCIPKDNNNYLACKGDPDKEHQQHLVDVDKDETLLNKVNNQHQVLQAKTPEYPKFDISQLLIPFENEYHSSLCNLKTEQDIISLQLELENYLSSSTCDLTAANASAINARKELTSINSLSSSFKNSIDFNEERTTISPTTIPANYQDFFLFPNNSDGSEPEESRSCSSPFATSSHHSYMSIDYSHRNEPVLDASSPSNNTSYSSSSGNKETSKKFEKSSAKLKKSKDVTKTAKCSVSVILNHKAYQGNKDSSKNISNNTTNLVTSTASTNNNCLSIKQEMDEGESVSSQNTSVINHFKNDHDYCCVRNDADNVNGINNNAQRNNYSDSITTSKQNNGSDNLFKTSSKTTGQQQVAAMVNIGQRFKNNLSHIAKSFKNQMGAASNVTTTTITTSPVAKKSCAGEQHLNEAEDYSCKLSHSGKVVSLLRLRKNSCSMTTTTEEQLNQGQDDRNILSFLVSAAKDKINELRANKTNTEGGTPSSGGHNHRKRQISTNSITYDLAAVLGTGKKFAPHWGQRSRRNCEEEMNHLPLNNSVSGGYCMKKVPPSFNNTIAPSSSQHDSIITTITDRMGNVVVVLDDPPASPINSMDTKNEVVLNKVSPADINDLRETSLAITLSSAPSSQNANTPVASEKIFPLTNPVSNIPSGPDRVLVDGLYLDNQFLAFLDDETNLQGISSITDPRTEHQNSMEKDHFDEQSIRSSTLAMDQSLPPTTSLIEDITITSTNNNTYKSTKSNSLPSGTLLNVNAPLQASREVTSKRNLLKKNSSFSDQPDAVAAVINPSLSNATIPIETNSKVKNAIGNCCNNSTKPSALNVITQTARGLFTKSLWNDFTLNELKFVNTPTSSTIATDTSHANNYSSIHDTQHSSLHDSDNSKPVKTNSTSTKMKIDTPQPFKVDCDRTVKIYPLDNDLTANELRNLFKKFGMIQDLKITDGIAYLTYTNSRDATTAIRRGNHIAGDRKFTVNRIAQDNFTDSINTSSPKTTTLNEINCSMMVCSKTQTTSSPVVKPSCSSKPIEIVSSKNFNENTTTAIQTRKKTATVEATSVENFLGSTKSSAKTNSASNKNYQNTLKSGTFPDYKNNGYRNSPSHKTKKRGGH